MSRILRVLNIEDSADDAELLRAELLRSTYTIEFQRVETREAMQAALQNQRWDLIISDYSMPLFSAPEAFAVLSESGMDIPFIIVSGTVGEETAVSAMKLGAQDYLLKGNLQRLVPAIERELRECESRKARRAAEQALLKSEERYRALFDGTPVPMWVFDVETLAFLAVNDAAVSHYGYGRDEFAHMTVDALEAGDEQIAPDAGLVALQASRGASTATHRTKGGALIVAEVSTHDFDFEGTRARLVAINDVTERLRAEQALRKAEDQLRQAQKMEAIGNLSAGIAHDFNNLLTIILSYTSLAVAGLESGNPLRADLEEVAKAGERAADLTRQLLAFSRQQVLEPRVLDINYVVRSVDKMLRRLLGEHIELSILAGSTVGKILADPGQLEQVIMNLAVNARDAMPNGGKLTIETAEAMLDYKAVADHDGVSPGSYVMLAVTDTGTGIDQATQARIFEPFFTTKEQGKGTGLGLSTVYGIIKQSGGHISVESQLGEGTTFRIYFPRTDRQADAGGVRPLAPSTLEGTETILLVEDDDQVRAVERSILRRHGYKVLEAQNGGEAFLVCESFTARIDLLITDIVMPRMSGPTLAQRLAPMRPEMKVLYISGYSASAQHGARDPGVAYLQKPVMPETFALKVREILDAPDTRR